MSRRTTRRAAAGLAAVLLASSLAACGSGDDEGAEEATPSGETSGAAGGVEDVTVTGDFGAAPKVEVSDLEAEALASDVLVEGDGPTLDLGESALISMFIVNGSTGKKAYSSYDQDRPELLVLDESRFLPALVPELEGLTQGSRLVITSSVEEAIGAEGATQIGLAPEQSVVFVIDLQAVGEAVSGDAEELPEGMPTIVEEDGTVTGVDFSDAPETPGDELQIETVIEGDGAAIAKGDHVIVDYYGVVYGEDEAFDENFSGDPTTFPVGTGNLIKAWDQGLIGVKAGTRLVMVTPPDLAYGEEGSGESIPPDSTLVFVIDVLGVAPKA